MNTENINYKQLLFDWAESYFGCDVCRNNIRPSSLCEQSCVFELDVEKFVPRLNDEFLCEAFGGGCPLYDEPKKLEDYLV